MIVLLACPLERSPRAPAGVALPKQWGTGRDLVIAGTAAAVGGTVTHVVVGSAEGRFWESPVSTFAVASEMGGATSVLIGAGTQRRALRHYGTRVNVVALVTGWICCGAGTAWLAGSTLTGGPDAAVNPGNALVGAGMALGIVQARVNAGAAEW